jgi:nitrite reductase (NO-forming)
MQPEGGTRSVRARRQVLATGLVLGYLAAGGVTLALGDRVAGGTWLALHLVLLGGLTNAIVAWSEHFAAALLRPRRPTRCRRSAGRWRRWPAGWR